VQCLGIQVTVEYQATNPSVVRTSRVKVAVPIGAGRLLTKAYEEGHF
jgi:hypothetical protein